MADIEYLEGGLGIPPQAPILLNLLKNLWSGVSQNDLDTANTTLGSIANWGAATTANKFNALLIALAIVAFTVAYHDKVIKRIEARLE